MMAAVYKGVVWAMLADGFDEKISSLVPYFVPSVLQIFSVIHSVFVYVIFLFT